MTGSPYSPLKIYFHPTKLQTLRVGMQTVPLQVQLIVSDLCQQSCSFCAYRMEGYASNQLFGVTRADGTTNNNPNRMIPIEKILEILDDCVTMGVKAVQLTGGGEPTIHPHFEATVNAVLERSLDLALVTNGVRLSDRVIDRLTEAHWVRFSLDAALPTTYAAIRRVPTHHYESAVANVKQLVRARMRRAHALPLLIGVGFVVTKENWREVFAAAAVAKSWGVDNFRISAVFQPEDASYFAGFYEDASNLCKATETMSDDSFRVFNLFGDRVSDLELQHPDYSYCGYQELVTYIGGDQNVYRCCNLAYNERGLIGSIKDQRFKDLWLSAGKRLDFKHFDATGCPRCQFNNKNRAILDAIADTTPPQGEPPDHLNFV